MSEARRTVTRRQRRALLHRQNGCCAACGATINLARRDRFEVDHAVPLALGGADDWQNWQAICVPCHRAKTGEDVTRIAKAKRVAAKHQGTHRAARHPLPGGRLSPWKRKLDGTVERRQQE